MKYLLFVVMAVACVAANQIRQPPEAGDRLRQLQQEAVASNVASWGHWGPQEGKYSSWKNHSNRLVPVYTFGLSLDEVQGEKSVYRSREALELLYGQVPPATLNPAAEYFDQTDIYRLQKQAIDAGKKYVVLMVFDGLDWETTRAAATYSAGRTYAKGRGNGLAFQDYRGTQTDYGYFVTSPYNDGAVADTNAQRTSPKANALAGGYDWQGAGSTPWSTPADPQVIIARSRRRPEAYTDSASSMTSMTCGIKTFNGAVNVDSDGKPVASLARLLQQRGFGIGVVSSVPISHATPAACYANNVNRSDYQDLTRDLVGLKSVAHRKNPLAGVDVLLGAGWGEDVSADPAQGANFVPGNKYIAATDLKSIDVRNGGKYHVVQRTRGKSGRDSLRAATQGAVAAGERLFGLFGVTRGHLPFRTADGDYNPAASVGRAAEHYSKADLYENPTLAEMTQAALAVLEKNTNGFWLMVEPGDVDWANHRNNIDNSIGAVKCGADAFEVIAKWAELDDRWKQTAVIVTADHGHYLVLTDPMALVNSRSGE